MEELCNNVCGAIQRSRRQPTSVTYLNVSKMGGPISTIAQHPVSCIISDAPHIQIYNYSRSQNLVPQQLACMFLDCRTKLYQQFCTSPLHNDNISNTNGIESPCCLFNVWMQNERSGWANTLNSPGCQNLKIAMTGHLGVHRQLISPSYTLDNFITF